MRQAAQHRLQLAAAQVMAQQPGGQPEHQEAARRARRQAGERRGDYLPQGPLHVVQPLLGACPGGRREPAPDPRRDLIHLLLGGGRPDDQVR